MWRPRISTWWRDDSLASTSSTAEALILRQKDTLMDLKFLQNVGNAKIAADVSSVHPSTSRCRRRGRCLTIPTSPASVKWVRLATRCSRAKIMRHKVSKSLIKESYWVYRPFKIKLLEQDSNSWQSTGFVNIDHAVSMDRRECLFSVPASLAAGTHYVESRGSLNLFLAQN